MYCKHCGNQLSDTAKFCGKCGKNIEETVQGKVSTNTETPVFAPAEIWRRLVNYIIDNICQIIFSFIVGFLIGILLMIMGIKSDSLGGWWTLIQFACYLGYFILFESIWQKSIAKFITKTKVVMRNGSKPPFKNIVGRTFARMIPFEQFSFLFGSYPVGWHDMLSNTLVVPSSYTEEDVKKIDVDAVKKKSGGNSAVVIAVAVFGVFIAISVIGILSSVVLVSLNTARQTGQNARIMSNLSQMRTIAEVYYGGNGNSYSSAQNCNSGMFQEQNMQQLISGVPNTTVNCYAKISSYAISSKLKSSDKSYCVDSSGYNGGGVAVDDGVVASCKANTVPVNINFKY